MAWNPVKRDPGGTLEHRRKNGSDLIRNTVPAAWVTQAAEWIVRNRVGREPSPSRGVAPRAWASYAKTGGSRCGYPLHRRELALDPIGRRSDPDESNALTVIE
jgi:hypothetical protein